MSFMDPEKAISALQALQAGPAMRRFNDALGSTAETVAHDAAMDVATRIEARFGAAAGEAYLKGRGMLS